MTLSFSLIVAVDQNNGIGQNGRLPWQLSADLKHFKEITQATKNLLKKNIVIMGRKTWESLPEKFRPLPGRINIILSRKIEPLKTSDVFWVSDFDTALRKSEELIKDGMGESVFVIGGAQIFTLSIAHPQCKRLFLTYIKKVFSCDTFFPPIDPKTYEKVNVSPVFSENQLDYFFAEYVRK